MGLSTIDKTVPEPILYRKGDLFGKIIIISEGSQYNQKRYCKIFLLQKKHIINGVGLILGKLSIPLFF
jgi:hypothetical protein